MSSTTPAGVFLLFTPAGVEEEEEDTCNLPAGGINLFLLFFTT